MRKIALILFGVLLVILFAGGLFAGNYFCDYALLSKAYDGVSADPAFSADYSAYGAESAEDLYRKAPDGAQLHAIQILQSQKSGKWAVILHGYGSSAVNMLNFSMQYYYNGYNVLLPDLRGHGMSDGKYVTMGWTDRLDMVDWAALIVKEYPDAQIVFHGISMGGATVMMLSGEKLPKNVKCLVEDCGYTSVYDEFADQLKEQFRLPAFPLLDLTSLVSKFKAGFFFREASSIKQLKKNTTPILFIHGTEDTFVPFEMVKRNYAATNAPKQLLTVEGAAHAQSDEVDPGLYWDTVNTFVTQYIK